jgi:hypothetical protein
VIEVIRRFVQLTISGDSVVLYSVAFGPFVATQTLAVCQIKCLDYIECTSGVECVAAASRRQDLDTVVDGG